MKKVYVKTKASNIDGAPEVSAGTILTKTAEKKQKLITKTQEIFERAHVLNVSVIDYINGMRNGIYPRTCTDELLDYIEENSLPEANNQTSQKEISLEPIPVIKLSPQKENIIETTQVSKISKSNKISKLKNKVWKNVDNLIKFERLLFFTIEKSKQNSRNALLEINNLINEIEKSGVEYLEEMLAREEWLTLFTKNRKNLNLTDVAIFESFKQYSEKLSLSGAIKRRKKENKKNNVKTEKRKYTKKQK